MAIRKNGAVVGQLRTLFDLGTIRELTDGQLLERFTSEPVKEFDCVPFQVSDHLSSRCLFKNAIHRLIFSF